MKLKFLFILLLATLLTACGTPFVPLQPGEQYYNSKLTLTEPQYIHPSLFMLGFNVQAGDYKAFGRNNDGVFFSSSMPIMGIDNLVGNVYRSGGIFFSPTKNRIYLYLADTTGFDGISILPNPLPTTHYKIIMHSKQD